MTASQPAVALNPGVPHPGLFPTVMSLNAPACAAPSAYSSGFRKPSGGAPAERRAELSSETKPANVGAAAEVPPMSPERPPRKMRKLSAWAATSGMAW